ncbi:MAG: aminotransferase class I/II-fold pyridoxal phosphate-dependent enzyme [Acidimicrobiia bacterium]|nr:aminotransferase class I/II-fold pyridoxal phosphate-dependent enzyme [Acidimicrobiia bacterium]
MRARVEHGVLGYTEAGPGFFDAVIGWVGRRRHWSIEREWITPCPGIMPSMAHLLRATLEPGDGVIVQSPAFSPIPVIVEQNGLRVVDQSLRLTDNRYHMDVEAFRAAAERPDVRAFVLCSPHNPMGRVWSQDELALVAGIAAANDLLVISDEIHAEVVFPWAQFVSYADVAPDSSRFAILFGPSKGFNLPGLRTAVAVIPHTGLRAAFHRELHQVNEDFGVNVMGAIALEAAYGRGAEWLDALAGYLAGNLEVLQAGVTERLPGVEVITPDASFLVWLDCRALGLPDDELQKRIVDQAGVVIEPGIAFGANGSGFIRLNIGTQRGRVTAAIERMVAAL